MDSGAGDREWTLGGPCGREAITAYNPLCQNRTHAEVISALCRVPVTALAVSAGFLAVTPERPERTKRPDLTDKRTKLERIGEILQAGQRVCSIPAAAIGPGPV
jgi:hypothetical protein